jgi:hypothetical protein
MATAASTSPAWALPMMRAATFLRESELHRDSAAVGAGELATHAIPEAVIDVIGEVSFADALAAV